MAHDSPLQKKPTKLLDQVREALRLRIKDLDFAQQQIIVRDGEGRKNRITMLPASALTERQDH